MVTDLSASIKVVIFTGSIVLAIFAAILMIFYAIRHLLDCLHSTITAKNLKIRENVPFVFIFADIELILR